MRKTKSLLFVLLACALVSCNTQKTGSSSPVSSVISSTPSISSPSSSKLSSSSSSSKPSSSSSSSSPISSSEDVSSSSSFSDTDYSHSKWNSDTIDLMLLHLDNRIIPDLGSDAEETTEWKYTYDSFYDATDFGHLEIATSLDYSETLVSSYEPIFTAAGYTKVSLVLYTKGNITVEFKNSGSLLYLDVSMSETYDATKASAGWDNYVIDALNTDLKNQASVIPYFYMGTAHNVSNPYYYSGDHNIYIWGGAWNEDVLNQAESAFTTALGWANQVKGNDSFTASKTLNSGDQFNIKVSKGKGVGPVQLAITYRAGYDPDAYSKWSDDTIQSIKDNFDGHEIPFLYIGTDEPAVDGPTTTSAYGYTYMTLTGITFHEDMLKDSKKALTSAGWTVSAGSDSNGPTVEGTKKMEDGCFFQLVVGKDYYGSARVSINYSKKLSIPSGSAYQATTQSAITKYLGGNDIPYFYLNLVDSNTQASLNETTLYDAASRSLTIIGGDWNRNIILDAVANKELEDWDIKTQTLDELVASRTYDNGDAITLTVQRGQDSTTGSKIDKHAIATFTYKEAWDNDNKVVAWDEDVKNSLKKNLGTDAVPYLYLGSSYVGSSYNASTRTVSLYGNAWNESALKTSFANTFKGKTTDSTTNTLTWSWVASNPSVGNGGSALFKATGTDSEGNRLLVQVQKDKNGFTMMTISYLNAFKPEGNTAWTADNQKVFTSVFGDTDKDELPYIYLGTATPSAESKFDGTSYITLLGGGWSDQVFDLAKITFTTTAGEEKTQGWTVQEGGNTVYFSFMAYKKLKSGASLRVYLHRTSADDMAQIQMDVFYDPALSSANAANLNATDWTADGKAKMKKFADYDLPYFSVPTLPTSNYSYSTGFNMSSYSLSDTKLSVPYFTWALRAQEDIEKAGGSATIDLVGYSTSFANDSWMLNGRIPVDKTDATKGFFLVSYYVNISYYSYVSGTLNIYYNYYPYFNKDEASAWSGNTEDKMNSLFKEVIPYVYLGSLDPTVTTSYSSNSMAIEGKTWDDSILTTAKTTFEEAGWTTGADAIHYSTKALTATKASSDGRTIEVALYKSVNSQHSYIVPKMEIYIF
ncbi:MAG: hypothetical protein PUA93_04380 [Eubacteriales bacterium]|nr:hypothetical protein [Eubacteriales bacterium]